MYHFSSSLMCVFVITAQFLNWNVFLNNCFGIKQLANILTIIAFISKVLLNMSIEVSMMNSGFVVLLLSIKEKLLFFIGFKSLFLHIFIDRYLKFLLQFYL